jgi:flavin-dependent dehydrogenase
LADTLRAQAIERGAALVHCETLLQIEHLHGSWRLGYETAGVHGILTGQYLVDASGRASVIGHRLGSRRMLFDDLFCISASLDQLDLTGTWTEASVDGWWNLCCEEHEGTLSFFSTARNIRKRKQDFAGHLVEAGQIQRLLPDTRLSDIRVRPCSSSRLVPCAGPYWMSLGDAASTVQPLASGGVSKALRDACMVRRAFRQPADYELFQQRKFSLYLCELAQQYAIEDRWPESRFWGRHLERDAPKSRGDKATSLRQPLDHSEQGATVNSGDATGSEYYYFDWDKWGIDEFPARTTLH